MSDDWKVGDLAVCVDDGDIPCGIFIHDGNAQIVKGRSIKVSSIAASPCGCLELHWPDGPRFGGHADRFRKIRPDKHEDCEPEFVTLLKRSKVTA